VAVSHAAISSEGLRPQYHDRAPLGAPVIPAGARAYAAELVAMNPDGIFGAPSSAFSGNAAGDPHHTGAEVT
jgi:hypothetical protein